MVDDFIEIEWPNGQRDTFDCSPEVIESLVSLANDALRFGYDLIGARPSTSPGNWTPCTRVSSRGLDR